MARRDELLAEVIAAGAVFDPLSKGKYFPKKKELQEWSDGDDEVRGRLERRWDRKYSAHQKRQAVARAAARKARSS